MWREIENIASENRHELILHGNEISRRIDTKGLDKNLFNLISLNLLRISDTNLDLLSDEISKLVNLQSLLLHGNKLKSITTEIVKLSKLKVLDLSNNQLGDMPDVLHKLVQLTMINISSNQLERFPSVAENIKLSVLDLSNNKLTEFPDICHSELSLLSEVKLKSNAITVIPSEINVLSGLKLLDLSSNKINSIPGELSDCNKLKEVDLKNNPVQDRRLYKLIEQCRTKQVLDYVRQHCARKGGKAPTGGTKKSTKKNKVEQKMNESENSLVDKMNNCDMEETDDNRLKIVVAKVTDEDVVPDIRIADKVKTVRPFIVACVVNNLKFDEQNFRKFIQMQTKLHETICDKRTAATIATHDLNKLLALNQNENSSSNDLIYTAQPPDELFIRPLGRGGQLCSGTKLFQQLKTEAENLRREKKRNTYSGVHKYLHLLDGRPLFPCLCDATGRVISFPPITNSEDTRIGLETKDLLIEVTSATGINICRKVMDAILKETVLLSLSNGAAPQNLTVQRVKTVDLEGNLRSVYPSKVDLIFDPEDGICVKRE